MNSMPNNSLSGLLLGTFTIATLHALIPSHWLSFALVGSANRWPIRRTLLVTMLAGSGHALLTMVLGLLVAGVGKGLQRAIPPYAEHALTASVLILLGIYFLAPALRGRSTSCSHPAHAHGSELSAEVYESEQQNPVDPLPTTLAGRLGKGPTIMGALVLGLTLSPCLDLLSVYVAAAALSWPLLLLISLEMAATTVTLMTLLVWLTLHGLQFLRLAWLERNEGLVVGVTLIGLGIMLFFVK